MTNLPKINRAVKCYPTQSNFCKSRALYRAFCGGIGSGKTWVGSHDLLSRAIEGRTYMVVGPTFTSLSDSTLRSFLTMGRDLKLINPDSVRLSTPPQLTLAIGADVLFRSGDRPDSLRGPNLSGVWLDEASLMSREVFDIAIGRLREAGEQGWLTATFTPKGPTHWTYDAFATGKPNTVLFRASTRDNRYLPPHFEETLRIQYGDSQFARQELGGEFVQVEGAEFPAEWFDFPGFWFTAWPDNCSHKVLYLDPSKGKNDKAGDYQCYALAGLARLPEVGNCIMLDAWLGHEPLPRLIERGVQIVREWQPDWVGYEDNGTMGFMAPEIARQIAGQMLPFWWPITNSQSKLGRMRVLGSYLSRRMIRIRNTAGGRLLRAQMGDVPFGEYDDGPDAAAGAVKALQALVLG